MADKTIKAKLELDTGEYTGGMQKASQSNDQYAASAAEVSDQTQHQIEALRECQGLVGDMDSSVRGATGALEHFGFITGESAKEINNMGEGAALTEAFFRPFVQMAIIATATNWQLAASMGAVATASMAMGATIALSGAKSKKQVALWSTMTGILWGLTAAQVAYAISSSAAVTLGVGAAATAAMIAVAFAMGTASLKEAKSAQSTPSSPTIINTHADETVTVTRGSGGGSQPGGGRGRVYLVSLERGHANLKRVLGEAFDMESDRSGI